MVKTPPAAQFSVSDPATAVCAVPVPPVRSWYDISGLVVVVDDEAAYCVAAPFVVIVPVPLNTVAAAATNFATLDVSAAAVVLMTPPPRV